MGPALRSCAIALGRRRRGGALAIGTLIDAHVISPDRTKIAFAGGDGVKGTGEIYLAEFEWVGKQPESTGIRFANVRAWDQSDGLELTTSGAAGDLAPAIGVAAPREKAAPPSASPGSSRRCALAGTCLSTATASAIGPYVRIEQDWALEMATVDPNFPSQQISILMKPLPDCPQGGVLLLNYSDMPSFAAGG